MLATNDPRKKEVKIQDKRRLSKTSRLKRGLSSPFLFTMNTITIRIGWYLRKCNFQFMSYIASNKTPA
jgi:hypothetical protein